MNRFFPQADPVLQGLIELPGEMAPRLERGGRVRPDRAGALFGFQVGVVVPLGQGQGRQQQRRAQADEDAIRDGEGLVHQNLK